MSLHLSSYICCKSKTNCYDRLLLYGGSLRKIPSVDKSLHLEHLKSPGRRMLRSQRKRLPRKKKQRAANKYRKYMTPRIHSGC